MPELVSVFIRAISAYLVLLLLARLMGRIQIAQLTFFDYITGITIGSIAASMAINTSLPVTTALAGLILWAGFTLINQWLVLKNMAARKIIQGEPAVVISNGQLMEEAMARAHLNIDEMMTQLRQQKIFNLSEVQEAVLETSGQLSVLSKPNPSSSPSPNPDTNTNTTVMQPVTLVVDGNIAHHRMKNLGLDETWLREELKKQGADDIADVMVAQLGTSGDLYVDKKQDWEVEGTGAV